MCIRDRSHVVCQGWSPHTPHSALPSLPHYDLRGLFHVLLFHLWCHCSSIPGAFISDSFKFLYFLFILTIAILSPCRVPLYLSFTYRGKCHFHSLCAFIVPFTQHPTVTTIEQCWNSYSFTKSHLSIWTRFIVIIPSISPHHLFFLCIPCQVSRTFPLSDRAEHFLFQPTLWCWRGLLHRFRFSLRILHFRMNYKTLYFTTRSPCVPNKQLMVCHTLHFNGCRL